VTPGPAATPARCPHPLDPILLRTTVNLCAGAPGVGKTAFLAWFIHRIQRGEKIFGRQPAPIPFQGFIGADRSWTESTSRWMDLEELDPLPHYSLQDDRAFRKARLRNKRDRIHIFGECLAALSLAGDGRFPLGSLIYVDPLALFLGGNLIDYDTCLVACSEIREICTDKGIAIIGTAHAAKQKADKADRYLRLQDRILGSAALFGYTDTQLYLASPDECGTDCYTFLWAPHHAPTELFSMTRDHRGLFIPGDRIAELNPPAFDPAWIVELLKKAPKHVLQLATIIRTGKGLELSRMTVIRQIKRLLDEGRIAQVRHGFYGLPPEH
jgi:hypothetical protein